MLTRSTLLLLLLTSSAAADDHRSPAARLFAHETSLSLDLGGGAAINNDDMAVDLGGSHSMASLQAAYRLKTGTAAFVMGGFVLGGHESMFPSYGAGLRQYFNLGRFEPFLDVGIYEVGDDVRLAPAVGFGAGVDVRLNDRFYTGASVTRFLSADSDELGGLDWLARIYIGARFSP